MSFFLYITLNLSCGVDLFGNKVIVALFDWTTSITMIALLSKCRQLVSPESIWYRKVYALTAGLLVLCFDTIIDVLII